MNRNWYAVYTRPLKEKKLVYLLNKKGIENFCPVTSIKEGRGEYKKTAEQPLFGSVVFVHIAESEIKSLLSFSWVVTIAYWKSKPAIISDGEIDIVRKVTDTYADIKLEKTAVEIGCEAKILDAPTVEYKEKTISVKYKSVKVSLPSLGFVMTAERIKQKAEVIYEQAGLFASFPKRINAFFFN
ncbi:MAG: transcription termination/antitermination NusG family protein [Bacteroidota bacterium]